MNKIDWHGERILPTQSSIDAAVNHIARYAFAKKLVSGKVLDAACGAGYGSFILSNKKYTNVIGIDIEEGAIKWAKRFYLTDEKVSNLNFKVEDIYNLSFANKSFDCIVSFETLEHLPYLDRYFQELKRVLALNGKLIISVPDYDTNIGAGSPNPYHLNELKLHEFDDYLKKYFKRHSLYYQELEAQNKVSRLKSLVASILPSKTKAWLKSFFFSFNAENFFDGKDYLAFEKKQKNLFSQYAVKKLRLNSFVKKNNKRYVFLAICN